MATIFPLSATVGQEFDGYLFDGTIWNLIGNEYNPTSFSSTAPENPKPGDLWVDSITNVPVLSINNVAYQSDLNDYLTLQSASTNYATVDYVENELSNIDLNDAITTASAAAVSYLVDSAPEALNTLNELAAALGDDENFATTITNSLSNKLDISVASSTYLTSASMQTVPIYVMNTGTTAERPASPTDGMFRFNTTTGYPEWYDPSENQWINFYQTRVIPLSINYLVIAGGGGGGRTRAGGGGAGGYLTSTTLFAMGTSIAVTVGLGGGGSTNTALAGSVGNNSVFSNITCNGGGGGGSNAGQNAGTSGGSGGGSSIWSETGSAGIAGQGFAGGGMPGGYTGLGTGGGGGAGGVGGNGAAGGVGGTGGVGLSSSITGSSVFRAGGGGGGIASGGGPAGAGGNGGGGAGGNASVGSNGIANTGGGGGGGGQLNGNANEYNGGNGGSGVVILSYLSTSTITLGPGLTGTTATLGSNSVTTITAGTGTVSWA